MSSGESEPMRKRRLMVALSSSCCRVSQRALRSTKAMNSSVPMAMLRGMRMFTPGKTWSRLRLASRALVKATPRPLPPHGALGQAEDVVLLPVEAVGEADDLALGLQGLDEVPHVDEEGRRSSGSSKSCTFTLSTTWATCTSPRAMSQAEKWSREA